MIHIQNQNSFLNWNISMYKKAKLLTDNIYLKAGLKIYTSSFRARKLNISKVIKKLLFLKWMSLLNKNPQINQWTNQSNKKPK